MPPRAPKVVKEENHPDILGEDYLKSLSRAQIQGLAKQNGIKANGKTEAMIAELLAKQPKVANETLAETNNEEVEIARPTKRVGKPSGATVKGIRNLISAPAEEAPADVVPARRGKRSAPTQPSREAKAPKKARRGTPTAEIQEPQAVLEEPQAPGTSNDIPQVPTGEEAGNKVARVAGEAAPAPERMPPTVQDIINVQKRLASLVKDRAAMKKDLDETKSTLSYAMDTLESGTKFIQEMTFRRQIYEKEIVEKMKAAEEEVVEVTNVVDEDDDMYMPA